VEPTVQAVFRPADRGDDGAGADAELARRLVEWLSADEEGRRILRALAERPAAGADALARRLQRLDVLQPAAIVGVEPWRRPDVGDQRSATRGLAGLLPLAGTGLFLGGFFGFMLGVLSIGLGDPGRPPLFVFGITLMLLAAAPITAGGILARHRPARLDGASRLLITLAVVVVAVTVATAVAGLLGR
jgi:hypothetical protein